MRRRILLTLGLLAVLTGCGLLSGQPEMGPPEVVTKFYRWYVGYPGNPLADREYRESPYLSQSFIQEVDEALEGGFRADPILLAQDIPERFTIDETDVSGDEATVIVSLYWSANPVPSRRKVDLRLLQGEWKITGVAVVEP